MTLLDLLHEQYDVDGDLVVFRCSECGFVSLSLGGLYGHIEGHRGYTRFGFQIPFTKEARANTDELMKRTEILRVTETEATTLEAIKE